MIHATIIKQDEPSDDQSSVYHIFERLNTGGTLLQPQEIRACIFHGPFADLLEELNLDPHWRKIYGPPSKRLKDQELILRFLALFFSMKTYSRPMSEFLGKFMGGNRYLKKVAADQIRQTFLPAAAVCSTLEGKAFRPERALNAAVCDSVMVGLATRLTRGNITKPSQFKAAYDHLLNDAKYISAIKKATADEANVALRTDKAIGAFAGIH